MKITVKRILSLFIALLLVFTLSPAITASENGEGFEPPGNTQEELLQPRVNPAITVKDSKKTGDSYTEISFNLYDPLGISAVFLNGTPLTIAPAALVEINVIKLDWAAAVLGDNLLRVQNSKGEEAGFAFKLAAEPEPPAPLVVQAAYSAEGLTNKDVTVTLSASEPVEDIPGWARQSGTVLTRVYTQNANDFLKVTAVSGAKADIHINVSNIDKEAPQVSVNADISKEADGSYTEISFKLQDTGGISAVYLNGIPLAITPAALVNINGIKPGSGWDAEVLGKNTLKAVDGAGNEASFVFYLVPEPPADVTPPEAVVSYSTATPTNKPVTVTLTASEPVKDIPDWERVSGNVFTKVYAANTAEGGEALGIEDLAGNKAVIIIIVGNIDITPPVVQITYSPETFTNQNITVQLTADKPVTVPGWTQINDYTLEKIYTENTEETVIVTDLAGNETSAAVKVDKIDRVKPAITLNESLSTRFASGFTKVSVDIFDVNGCAKVFLNEKLILDYSDAPLVNIRLEDLKMYSQWQYEALGENTLKVIDGAGNEEIFSFYLVKGSSSESSGSDGSKGSSIPDKDPVKKSKSSSVKSIGDNDVPLIENPLEREILSRKAAQSPAQNSYTGKPPGENKDTEPKDTEAPKPEAKPPIKKETTATPVLSPPDPVFTEPRVTPMPLAIVNIFILISVFTLAVISAFNYFRIKIYSGLLNSEDILHNSVLKLAGIPAFILASTLFILSQNIFGRLIIADIWSIALGVILLTQIVVTIAGFKSTGDYAGD